MGIGDILDTSIRLYRRNFVTFLTISLITYVPYALLVFLLQMMFGGGEAMGVMFGGSEAMGGGPFGAQAAPDADSSAAMFVNALGSLLFLFVVYPLTTGALTQAISDDFLGKQVRAGAAYRRAFGRLGALAWTQILVGAVVAIGFLLLIVPGIIFSLWFMIVPVIVLLERMSGSKAMGRGRELMKGNLGKGFLLNLVMTLLVAVVTFALMFGVGYLVATLSLPVAIVNLFNTLLSAVFIPVQLGAIVLLYYDLRVRKEAFDLQVLSESLPDEPNPT
jgi:hypothetical protein